MNKKLNHRADSGILSKKQLYAFLILVFCFLLLHIVPYIFNNIFEFIFAYKGRISMSYIIGGLIFTSSTLFIADKLTENKNRKLAYFLILLIAFVALIFWVGVDSCTESFFCEFANLIFFGLTIFIGGYFVFLILLNILLKWIFDKYNFGHKKSRNYVVQSIILSVILILITFLMKLQGII